MKGGCGAHRMMEEEKEQANLMIKKWGPEVVTYNFKRSTNPGVNGHPDGCRFGLLQIRFRQSTGIKVDSFAHFSRSNCHLLPQ